ncbi:hypothetical protein J6TS2_24310 [Heyndrickxia sporothermodurans]|nr:hypothetical protein J6TS2_24310 [Heyndrickxia sporothermodurans]
MADSPKDITMVKRLLKPDFQSCTENKPAKPRYRLSIVKIRVINNGLMVGNIE